MNDIDLHRYSAPHLVPAAAEFLRLSGIGAPQNQPQGETKTPRTRETQTDRTEGKRTRPSNGTPAQRRAERSEQAKQSKNTGIGQNEVALDLMRQVQDEIRRNPPSLYEAVLHNPTAQGQIFRRGLFVADEIQVKGPMMEFAKTDGGHVVAKQWRPRRRNQEQEQEAS